MFIMQNNGKNSARTSLSLTSIPLYNPYDMEKKLQKSPNRSTYRLVVIPPVADGFVASGPARLHPDKKHDAGHG